MSTVPGWAPDPRISVAGPDQETHHSVVLKKDQVVSFGSARGWHSVVPARHRLAGLAGVYIVYSLVPVWLGYRARVMGRLVYMNRTNRGSDRNRLDWTWILPILWAMLIASLIIIS